MVPVSAGLVLVVVGAVVVVARVVTTSVLAEVVSVVKTVAVVVKVVVSVSMGVDADDSLVVVANALQAKLAATRTAALISNTYSEYGHAGSNRETVRCAKGEKWREM
ncbi:hypothetical protein DL93DRAFT_2098287 [Clavulina sp. PMI_390]|nr:hypothetical protein DL93DRAFT_2098287 [Clavulina sp. PMI_390]